MAPAPVLRIPTGILADCRFAAAPNFPGTTPRPSGSGLTGADIAMFWLVLDAALAADDGNNVIIPQIRFRQVLGKADPVRISAALTRLEGTDLMHGYSVYPCVRSHGHLGQGTRNPRWAVELRSSLIDVVRKATDAGAMTELNPSAMKGLSSRLSMVLWCRFLSILDGAEPPMQIGYGKDPHTAAMEMSVRLGDIPAYFGRYERMLPSEINKLIMTGSKRSPIARELHAAGVACDITPVKRAGFQNQYGIDIQMTSFQRDGLQYISKLQRHRDLRAAARKARLETRMRLGAPPPSA